MTDRLDEIFARQRQLQLESFHVDVANLEGLPRERYVVQNGFAVVAELVKAFDNIDWKMWTTGSPARFKDRDSFVREMVDVLHFIMNLLLVADCDATELYTRYVRKAEVNAQRQLDGYDGISTKQDGRA